MIREAGRKTTAIAFWFVSSALGLVVMLQLYELSRLVAVLILPYDSEQTVSSAALVVTVSRFVLIILGIVWLVSIIPLLDRYLAWANDVRRLARGFAIVTGAELIILGVAQVALRWLPTLFLTSI